MNYMNGCFMNMKVKRYLFTLIQWTWGFPQTLLGTVFYVVLHKNKHGIFHGATVTYWRNESSLSLGKYIFMSESEYDNAGDGFLIRHEYGHCIQSLILGPLYLFIVGIPSVTWCNLALFKRYRNRRGKSYYEFLPEKNANNLCDRFIPEQHL